jgi:hypothetical protein
MNFEASASILAFAAVMIGAGVLLTRYRIRHPKLERAKPQLPLPPQDETTFREVVLTYGTIAGIIWLCGGWPWIVAHWHALAWSFLLTFFLTAGLQISAMLLISGWTALQTTVRRNRRRDWRGRPYQEILPPLVRQRRRPQGWID